MWYKKVKKVGMFWCWLVVKNIKKKEKKKYMSNVLFLDKQAQSFTSSIGRNIYTLLTLKKRVKQAAYIMAKTHPKMSQPRL
jgi:hypothetical protein